MASKKRGGQGRPENLPCQAVGDYSVTRGASARLACYLAAFTMAPITSAYPCVPFERLNTPDWWFAV
jgi:hypothetical protein